jgi:hypothetical protein
MPFAKAEVCALTVLLCLITNTECCLEETVSWIESKLLYLITACQERKLLMYEVKFEEKQLIEMTPLSFLFL